MRKNNTAIIFGSLFFSCSVMAANGTLAPTVVPMVNGGQASIAISNTSPNLFTVPGDRIIAVNSLDGALTNNEQTASGGVVVATFDDKVRQHATTEMQVTAAQMQKQYEEIRRELDVLNKQRGDDQRRIEKLGQDNAALAEQVKALGANPVTATGEPVPQMPASPPGPEGEPQPGNTPVSFPPQGSVAVPPPTAFYPGNGVTPPPQVTNQSVPVPNRIQRKVFTWLQLLLVWSPGQRDIIKTVALVLMVLDHANRILHLDQSWMFLVGRGAFPLFALVWGLNLSRHTHIRQEAINRLWGWAVIAQFAYYLAGFPWYEGNILFAFAVAAQVLTWCETRTWWRSAETMLLLAMWLPFSGTSYGIAGLLMLAVSHRLYRAEDRMERLALVACLPAVIPALNLATSDAAAVAGLVMTVLTVGLVSCAGKSLPRFWPGDFFPTFYACHLAVLGVLAL
ncbi:TPA: conjugal transfer pilus acetylase TraX [Escherichia coli]|nr:conjugal transfer pilus acetylase TraX [Escherichia coli]